MEDLYNKVKYNPSIVGILIINPDNPTGMVYPKEVLEGFVKIAKEFKLLLIADEIYQNITYNGVKAVALSEVIGDLPGISLKGISKEFPWPGSRCGWMEFYNRNASKEFTKFCQTLENAKMIEVCSTILPQLSIPKIMSHPAYMGYRQEANEKIGEEAALWKRFWGKSPASNLTLPKARFTIPWYSMRLFWMLNSFYPLKIQSYRSYWRIGFRKKACLWTNDLYIFFWPQPKSVWFRSVHSVLT
jgi:alanine-synthesizing transaminase